MKNKKAMELSINFLVMLIIAIVAFGFGLSFMAKFFTGAQQMKAQLDMDTEKRIEGLLNTGEQIAIPVNSKTLAGGKSAVFGVGILNILGKTYAFTTTIACSSVIDDTGAANPTYRTNYCLGKKWTISDTITETINNNEQKIESLLFAVPLGTPKGQYIFTVTVTANGKPYDVPRKIYVNVI